MGSVPCVSSRQQQPLQSRNYRPAAPAAALFHRLPRLAASRGPGLVLPRGTAEHAAGRGLQAAGQRCRCCRPTPRPLGTARAALSRSAEPGAPAGSCQPPQTRCPPSPLKPPQPRPLAATCMGDGFQERPPGPLVTPALTDKYVFCLLYVYIGFRGGKHLLLLAHLGV